MYEALLSFTQEHIDKERGVWDINKVERDRLNKCRLYLSGKSAFKNITFYLISNTMYPIILSKPKLTENFCINFTYTRAHAYSHTYTDR